MKTKRGFLAAILLFAAGLLFGGCGDSGSTDTVWLPSTGQAVLRGTVSSEEGLLMTDVPVTLLRSGVVVGAARTDEEGRFVFYSLEKGSYILEASAEGYALYSAELTVEGSMDWAIVLELAEPEMYRVSGNVGVTEDFPLSGLTVRLSQEMPQARAGDEEVFSAETDIDGNYEIEDVPAGLWYVEILLGEDLVIAYDEPLDVSSDESLNLLLGEEMIIVYGVITADGRPAIGAKMDLRLDADLSVVSKMVADSQGRYYFLNVEPDDYYVHGAYGTIYDASFNIVEFVSQTVRRDASFTD